MNVTEEYLPAFLTVRLRYPAPHSTQMPLGLLELNVDLLQLVLQVLVVFFQPLVLAGGSVLLGAEAVELGLELGGEKRRPIQAPTKEPAGEC